MRSVTSAWKEARRYESSWKVSGSWEAEEGEELVGSEESEWNMRSNTPEETAAETRSTGEERRGSALGEEATDSAEATNHWRVRPRAVA